MVSLTRNVFEFSNLFSLSETKFSLSIRKFCDLNDCISFIRNFFINDYVRQIRHYLCLTFWCYLLDLLTFLLLYQTFFHSLANRLHVHVPWKLWLMLIKAAILFSNIRVQVLWRNKQSVKYMTKSLKSKTYIHHTLWERSYTIWKMVPSSTRTISPKLQFQ